MARKNGDGGLTKSLITGDRLFRGLLMRLGMTLMRRENVCIRGWVLWYGMVGMLDFGWMIGCRWGPYVGFSLGFLNWRSIRNHLSRIALR